MPSTCRPHIFMAMGRWQESVDSNTASAQAALDKESPGRAYHALWWKHYSLLQLGRYQEAGRTLKQVDDLVAHAPSPSARRHSAYMRASQIIETQDWDFRPSRGLRCLRPQGQGPGGRVVRARDADGPQGFRGAVDPACPENKAPAETRRAEGQRRAGSPDHGPPTGGIPIASAGSEKTGPAPRQ